MKNKFLSAAVAAMILLLVPASGLQAMECLKSQVLGAIAPAGVDQPRT